MAHPEKFSKLQIVLHWLMFLLFLASFVSHDAVKASYRAFVREGVTDISVGTRVHVIVGIVLLALAVIRIVMRFTRPAPAEMGSGAQALLAKAVKLGLYVVMITIPLSGIAVWFGGIREAGDMHEVMFTLGLGLLGLHILGALVHQFVFKDNLMARMKLR